MRKIDILNKDYEKIGLDTIVYTNKTIDEVCYIDSDGKEFTYRDIFEDTNLILNPTFDEDISDWSDNANLVETWDHGRIKLEVLNDVPGSMYVQQTSQIGDIGSNYYIIYDYDMSSVVASFTFGVRLGYNDEQTFLDGAVGTYTNIILCSDVNPVRLSFYSASIGDIAIINNFFAIDMSIFTSEPSKTKLNEWRNIYLARKNIIKETYTLREFMMLSAIENVFFQDEDMSFTNQSDGEVVDKQYKFLSNGVDYIDLEYHTNFSIGTKIYYRLDVIENTKTAGAFFVTRNINLGDENGFQIADGETGKFCYTILASDYYGANIDGDIYLYLQNIVPSGEYIIIDNIFAVDYKYFDEFITEETFEYLITLYKQVKLEEEDSDKIYSKTGKSKFDIAYTNKTIDEVVYEGLTLRDIFEHGNYLTYIAGWQYQISNIVFDDLSVSFENTLLSIAGLGIDPNLPVDQNTWYLGINVNGKIGDEIATSLGNAYTSSLTLTEENQLVSRVISGTKGNRNELEVHYSSPSELNLTIEFKNIVFINMGIFIIEPSQSQMDTWRDMYLSRRNLEKIELTYSDIFEKNNHIINGSFEDADNDWSTSGSEWQILNEKLIIDVLAVSTYLLQAMNDFALEENVFISIENELISGAVSLGSGQLKTYGSIAIEYIGETDYSAIHQVDDSLGFTLLLGRGNDQTYKAVFDEVYFIGLNIFDERITQAQLDILLAEFKLIRNSIIVPEVFVITEPIGLGKRYKMLSVKDYIYGHELDFERIGFKMQFGINYSAYDGYNLMMIFLKNSEAIIEYDWGKGSRFADVKLLHAPKTEKDTLNLIVSKFAFELLNPFYELIEIDDSSVITNTHTQDLELKLEMQVDNVAVLLEMDCEGSENDLEIEFDFTGVSVPFNLIIDTEKKTITKDDGTNMYGYLNFSGDSFFVIPGGVSVNVFVTNGVSAVKITYKQWVVD